MICALDEPKQKHFCAIDNFMIFDQFGVKVDGTDLSNVRFSHNCETYVLITM